MPLRGFNVPCSKSRSGNLTSSSNERAASVSGGIIAWLWREQKASITDAASEIHFPY